ncbi:MAG: aldo/keto reductase [Eubacteriales bacterium]|nr:aldo/keto reductase [Eubacteriales bacterium]
MDRKIDYRQAAKELKSLADTFELANGVKIPALGFGTWLMPNDELGVAAVKEALALGYRHIDTAAAYQNEAAVGQAIKESGLAREEIFVTTKLANPEHGYHETKQAFAESLAKLGLDYLDLYLIHWPNPLKFRASWAEKNRESWRAFEELYQAGKIRAIGVSNFREHHLEALAESWEIKPQVNQIHICPGNLPQAQIEYCQAAGILLESYSPLGRGKIFEQAELVDLAKSLGRTVAQVVLRWHLQKGFLALPKSVTPAYIKENAEIFDFSLTAEEMQIIDHLEEGCCGLPKDPDQVDF